VSNYLFVYKAASCGGHCIAIFPEEKIADAFDYIANSPNSKFMHLYQGEWDAASEIPVGAKIKSIITPHSVKLIDLPDNPTINIEEDSINNRRQAFVEWMTRGNMEHRNKAKEHPLDCGWWKDWHNCSCGVFDK